MTHPPTSRGPGRAGVLGAALVAALLASSAGAASATCYEMEDLRLLLPGCEVPQDGVRWPVGQPVGFVGELESCCNAPHCPGSCNGTLQAPRLPEQAVITDLTGATVRATPREVEGCLGLPRYIFEPPLPLGRYTLMGAESGLSFEVVGDNEVQTAPLTELTWHTPAPPCGRQEPPPVEIEPTAGGCAGCATSPSIQTSGGWLLGLLMVLARRTSRRQARRRPG